MTLAALLAAAVPRSAPPCPYCRDPLEYRPNTGGRLTSDVITTLGTIRVNAQTVERRPADVLAWRCVPCEQYFFTPINPYAPQTAPGQGD